MHKTAVLTVIYPLAIPFFYEFFDSLRNQSYKNFDIIIINDGVSNLPRRLLAGLNYKIYNYNSTPAKNREYGLNVICESGYKEVILSDIDDYNRTDRIEKSLAYLNQCDCIVNDLNIVNSSGKLIISDYFKHSHVIPECINLDFLKDKNICGFSNTAIRTDIIYPVVFPKNVRIVDWYFFTKLLLEKRSIRFVPDALTYYRQHDNNEIGIEDSKTASFRKLIQFKIEHYTHLLNLDNDHHFQGYLEETMKLSNLTDSEIEKIISKNRVINSHPLWWENVKL